jgi:hypothetical protein
MGRGDEQDRARNRLFLHPAPDRERRRAARHGVGQEADGLGIGVEDRADRSAMRAASTAVSGLAMVLASLAWTALRSADMR